MATEMVEVIWKGFRIGGQEFELTNMWNHPEKRVTEMGASLSMRKVYFQRRRF